MKLWEKLFVVLLLIDAYKNARFRVWMRGCLFLTSLQFLLPHAPYLVIVAFFTCAIHFICHITYAFLLMCISIPSAYGFAISRVNIIDALLHQAQLCDLDVEFCLILNLNSAFIAAFIKGFSKRDIALY